MQQIITLGGGGFSVARAPGLDRYILSLSRTARPAVGFIPTASGDADAYLLRFYQAFAGTATKPSHLPFFGRVPDLAQYIAAQDVLYVGGGNTKSLLAVWREWGLPSLLRRAMDDGVILAGISAGAICWFEQGLTDSRGAGLERLDALGFIPGSCTPHYSDEPERKPRYRELIASREMMDGIAIDDDVGVHFIDGVPHRVIVGRHDSDAYRVERTDAGGVREFPLVVEHLSVIST